MRHSRYTLLIGIAFGYLLGVLWPDLRQIAQQFSRPAYFTPYGHTLQSNRNCICGRCNATIGSSSVARNSRSNSLATPPLPPGISVQETDLYMRRLWGIPSEDLPWKPRYLVTFAVGVQQKDNIDRAVQKFSGNFTVMLFHYDGKGSEWDELEWSKQAIHVSAPGQSKWWFAKRFLHPDVVAPYDYIFIWDEDLGLENFNAEEYLTIVQRHGLEISQPAMDPGSRGLTWVLTKRRRDAEVHQWVEVPYSNKRGGGGRCRDPFLPPCAAFVEMMAPVFSGKAWKCVWEMIQNDLVHGWGLDFKFHRCVQGGRESEDKVVAAYERMGVVDSQWVVHRHLSSLGLVGSVNQRRRMEARLFSDRWDEADLEHVCCEEHCVSDL